MLARMLNEFAPLMRLHETLHEQMNRAFEGFFDNAPAWRGYAATYPGVNLWEDGGTAYVEAELPGMAMEDLEIYVTGNQLTIAGQRNVAEPEGASWRRRERASGRFSRSLTLPWEIDADKVEARLHDGVLTVTLPKCESCRPKKIQVKALPAA